MDAQHKIALVTGGSRGLGKNTALRLSKSGMDVILTYRSKKEEAAEVVAQIEKNGQKAIALPLDVADTKSFDSFIQQVSASLQSVWGKEQFDFLINNAGIDNHAAFTETTEEAFDSLFNVHFKGTYFLTQKAIALPLDVADTKSFDSFIQQVSASLQSVWGKEQFDFLINNAGINGVVVLPDILILLGTHVAGIIGPFSTRKLGLCSKRARW